MQIIWLHIYCFGLKLNDIMLHLDLAQFVWCKSFTCVRAPLFERQQVKKARFGPQADGASSWDCVLKVMLNELMGEDASAILNAGGVQSFRSSDALWLKSSKMSNISNSTNMLLYDSFYLGPRFQLSFWDNNFCVKSESGHLYDEVRDGGVGTSTNFWRGKKSQAVLWQWINWPIGLS